MEASLWTLVVSILTSSQWSTVVAASCDQGWFGDKCQYKCRCQNDSCDLDGSCKGGATCQGGWFGPACQYSDIAFNKFSVASLSVAVDGNDSTCLNAVNFPSINFNLSDQFSFTWLRVRLSRPELLSTLVVGFGPDGIVQCKNSRNTTVDSSTMDVYCDTNQMIQYIHLSGDGINYMCSLYVSGGRNVALKQNASQTSVSGSYSSANGKNNNYTANNSVDGNQVALTQASCSVTSNRDPYPTWNVSFSRPQTVTRIVIYNRAVDGHLLTRFTLQAYDKDSADRVQTFIFNDNQTQITLIYYIQSKPFIAQVVSITATNGENWLQVCEVEVYGDSICEADRYGRDCEYRCNCTEPCFVSTGGCPSESKEDNSSQSINCDQGWFGHRCQYKCRCQNDNCDLDGSCKSGDTCQGGWFGPECQNADIAYKQPSVAFPVVVDGDDSTCLNNVDADFIKFDLGIYFYTSWLRVRISKPELLSTLEVKITSVTFNPPLDFTQDDFECSWNVTVDRYTMDCYYSIDIPVYNINISGEGMKYMCSLYVSGDGNSEARKTNSCSISEEGVPRWNDSFTNPEMIVITRIVLYYRAKEAKAFLATMIFAQQHKSKKPITLEEVKQSITELIASNNDFKELICEVGIYGESFCDPGWYGRDCEHICNCAGSEPCFVGTGGCFYGCAVGFQGENCKQPCPDNTYGKGCTTNCSQFCAKNMTNPQSCDSTFGTCVFGCVQGYKGLNCQETCSDNTYGKGCTTNCSQFCVKDLTNPQLCHHISGTCVFGCAQGYMGLTCQETDDNKSNLFAVWAVLAVIGGLMVFVPIYVFMRRRGKQEDKLRHININDNNKVDSIQATPSNDSVTFIKKRQLPEIIQQPITNEQYSQADYVSLLDYNLDIASSDNQDEKPTVEKPYDEIM